MPAESRPSGELELEHFLPYRLSVLTNTVSRALARTYRDRFGLSIPQWRVLAVLGREPGLSAAEVAERTVMDKVTVSRAVSALADSGRLLRSTDRRDGRRWVLRLSRSGRSIYARIVPLARSYERELARALTSRERLLLDRALDQLTRRARELESPGSSG